MSAGFHTVDAVAEMAAGLIDADLGGSVYKKRVPMPDRGKRGGARIILEPISKSRIAH